MKKKILVTYRLPQEGFAKILETNEFELILPRGTDSFSKEEITDRIKDVDFLLSIFNFKVDAEIIDSGKCLKMISNYGVGFNNIDIEYAKSKGITVTNTPDPVIEPTAELAFSLMGDLARRISECDRKIRVTDGLRWGVLENLGIGLYGKTLGIIGMGRIGQALARRAVASGMKVLYNNRHRLDPETEFTLRSQYVSFSNLLSEADFISINTPLNETTYHLIGKDAFKHMKESVFLINTARSAVINEKELADALSEKQIAGAALDVYEYEPRITESLLSLDNVILVPHIGTATISVRNAMTEYACENIILFSNGEEPRSRVV